MIDLQYKKTGISIQVGLSGYSFKVYDADGCTSSGWLAPERLFSSSQMQKRYDEVEISMFTHKFTLVPSQFHNPIEPRTILEEVADVLFEDNVETVAVPQFASVLVYSDSVGGSLPRVISEMVMQTDGTKVRPLPEVWYMLSVLEQIGEYNKIVASYMDGWLYLVIAQGNSLVLCNSFVAPDFTTAEYFIFLAMKKLQLNPELSAICFRTPLDQEQELSLYRYFRSVERL